MRAKKKQVEDEPLWKSDDLQRAVIVGVDASVEKTGVSVYPGLANKDGSLWHTRFVETPKLRDPARVVWIAETIAAIVSECTPEVVLLVIEQPVQSRGNPINMVLHWRIREELSKRFVTYALQVHPTHVKMFACNKAKAPKGTVAFQAARKWGDILPPDAEEDEIESLVMAKMGECWLTRDDGDWAAYELKIATKESAAQNARDREPVFDSGAIIEMENLEE